MRDVAERGKCSHDQKGPTGYSLQSERRGSPWKTPQEEQQRMDPLSQDGQTRRSECTEQQAGFYPMSQAHSAKGYTGLNKPEILMSCYYLLTMALMTRW